MNKLAEGVLGSKMVAYFELYENRDNAPVEAIHLGPAGEKDQQNYRMSFEDGTVADYLVTFVPNTFLEIESMEEYNRVI